MATNTRHNMVVGAASLLAKRGLSETSLSDVIELTGAPRGSIYHHFPGGKDELIEAAIALAGEHAINSISAFDGLNVIQVTSRFIDLWRSVLTASDFTAGCSVLAVTISTDSQDLLDRAALIFSTWRARLAEILHNAGLQPARAASFATLLVAATEGAVVLSRAEKSLDPFEQVAADLVRQAELLNLTPSAQ